MTLEDRIKKHIINESERKQNEKIEEILKKHDCKIIAK